MIMRCESQITELSVLATHMVDQNSTAMSQRRHSISQLDPNAPQVGHSLTFVYTVGFIPNTYRLAEPLTGSSSFRFHFDGCRLYRHSPFTVIYTTTSWQRSRRGDKVSRLGNSPAPWKTAIVTLQLGRSLLLLHGRRIWYGHFLRRTTIRHLVSRTDVKSIPVLLVKTVS